jgi:hypothetical protein
MEGSLNLEFGEGTLMDGSMNAGIFGKMPNFSSNDSDAIPKMPYSRICGKGICSMLKAQRSHIVAGKGNFPFDPVPQNKQNILPKCQTD